MELMVFVKLSPFKLSVDTTSRSLPKSSYHGSKRSAYSPPSKQQCAIKGRYNFAHFTIFSSRLGNNVQEFLLACEVLKHPVPCYIWAHLLSSTEGGSPKMSRSASLMLIEGPPAEGPPAPRSATFLPFRIPRPNKLITFHCTPPTALNPPSICPSTLGNERKATEGSSHPWDQDLWCSLE